MLSARRTNARIVISDLRAKTGHITLDPALGNSGACQSAITFIDGEQGILRYRGYSIEQLAENASFVEVCHLLIYGELAQRAASWPLFARSSRYHSMIHEDMKKFFEGYPPSGHPMAILSSMIASLSTYYPEAKTTAKS